MPLPLNKIYESFGKFRSTELGVLLSASFLFASCGGTVETQGKNYVLMEKQLADMPKRHRTTAKIVIQGTGNRVQGTEERQQGTVQEAMKQALDDLRNDDPELDAALIWAYKNRSELNNTFTLGKLEWSKDKKGWEGKQNLSEEIITEIRQ